MLEALQLETCDVNKVLARLQECLSLEQASLEQPDPGTKRLIRCICVKAKTAKRVDIVEKLREIAPAGTTGKAFFRYSRSLSRTNVLVYLRRPNT